MRAADRIVALATPPGRGAIGVVRLSGPSLPDLFPPLLGRAELTPRSATFTRFLGDDGRPIDAGLALFFPGPRSYTGEDVLELQGHGGPAAMAMLLRRCLALGARLAEPGEFTKRAYLNDRMDLVQAEAVADLIEAGSEAAARSALRSLEGEFSSQINVLVDQLTELRALVEACLDFPDEDVELLSRRGGYERLDQLQEQIDEVTAAAQAGRLLHEGAKVVLFGQPNVGKSTLLNRLAGAEVAIVTEIPGTTRDVLREVIQIQGVPIQILDTAGLRNTDDVVERLGVERTWSALKDADVGVLLIDARNGLTVQDQRLIEALPSALPLIVAANKADLLPVWPSQAEYLLMSARDGRGLEELKGRVLTAIGWQPPESGVFAARERHLSALKRVQMHIASARSRIEDLELFAEELRLAQMALGDITGRVTADELLGVIFSRFCIGK